jgi:hypothetical protein
MRIRFPDWSRVEDPFIREWLENLPERDQLKMMGWPVWKLDRACGDALMAECIAARRGAELEGAP